MRSLARSLSRVGYCLGLLLLGCGGGAAGKDRQNPPSTGGTNGSVGGSNATGGSGGSGGSATSGGTDSSGGSTQTSGGSGGSVPEGGSDSGGSGPVECDTPVVPTSTAQGDTGVWEDVTDVGMPLGGGGDHFGVQDVVADPARPSDFYAFVCLGGVWKSTDYGATWAKVNTGSEAAAFDNGKPWGAAIDSNRCRDPETPPTLYSLSSSGLGFYKSTDGGVNWTKSLIPGDTGWPNQDLYSINVDPYDGQHVIVGRHEAEGLYESTDGGATFTDVSPPDGSGGSQYGFFIDTGDATTTAMNWVTYGQWPGGGGMRHTTDGGASYEKVGDFQHFHGCATGFFPGDGVGYLAATLSDGGSGDTGLMKTTDGGASWNKIGNGNANAIIGTGTNLYANWGWANAGENDENMQTATRAADTSWSPMNSGSMTNGTKGAAVSFDGEHYVIVSGNWNAGVWRYIEP
jgi:hypothetical protein